ncbi:MAG: tetratricopeptide repeat protein [Pseudomonadota bacterium]
MSEALADALAAVRVATRRADPDAALRASRRVLQLDRENAEVHLLLARALLAKNRYLDALAEANHHIDLVGNTVDGMTLKLSALIGLNRPTPARRVAEQIEPDTSKSLQRTLALARVANNFGRPGDGLKLAEEVLVADPDNREAQNYRGRALIMLSRPDEAVQAYDQLLRGTPKNATFLYNRAVALMNSGQTAAALQDFDAVANKPTRPAYARFNRGLCRLTLGEFPAALDDFQARWELPDQRINRYVTAPIPFWSGEPLSGKRIVAFGEQGFGDIIQFVRFLPRLKELGAEVVLCVRKPLHPLLRRAFPDHRVLERVEDGEGYDFQISLIDIPRVMNTALDEVWSRPYLEAEPSRIDQWRDRIGANGLRIAIAWRGKESYGGNALRSPPLAAFEPLSQVSGVRLLSVQLGPGTQELRKLPKGMSVETLDGLDQGGGAFLDTAAVISVSDLVVTCDTSVAHLAGAMNRPAWVALPHVPDWRWMRGHESSPWYPSLRLFRQPEIGNWKSVFGEMAAALRSGALG